MPILGLLGLCCAHGVATAQDGDEVVVVDEKNDKKVTFAPEVETKLAELLKKIGEAKRDLWRERMKKEIGDIATATGLGDEGKKALEAPSEEAVGQCVSKWILPVEKQLRAIISQQAGRDPMRFLKQVAPHAGDWARSGGFPEEVQPTDRPEWTAALKKTLSPEQAAAWEKCQSDIRQTVEKEIANYMKTVTDRIRDQQERLILPKASEIAAVLNLPQERADQIKALAKEAAAKAMEGAAERQRKMMLSMEEAMRRQFIQQNGMVFGGSDGKATPDQQDVWKDGLNKLLSQEERQRIDAEREGRISRRNQAMARLMVMLLDDKVAFTASQRQLLLPVAERMVKKEMTAALDNQQPFSTIPPGSFFAAAAKAPEGEVKPVLDAIQWNRWQEACKTQASMGFPQRVGGGAPAPAAASSEPEPEPEEMERAISDFMQTKSEERRKRVYATAMLKVEDAERVAHPAADVAARLETAARGDAEETLMEWKSRIEQPIRMNFLRDANARNVKQRLAGMESYVFGDGFIGMNRRGGPGNETLWDKAVKKELTEEQIAAWKAETDGRDAFRQKAIASTLMVAFDRRNSLTPEQWEKLQPLIEHIIEDYTPDIANCFSPSNEIPWYLQFYTTFFPFAGIPEADFKAVLTKEQWDRWVSAEEHGNAASFWSNIQQNHDQRLRQQKEMEEREKREKEKREKKK